MNTDALHKTKTWFVDLLDKENTAYILGPCSAESREQVVETAIQIAKAHPKAVFRSGIWKPRTRPNNFEGIGKKGLSWLLEAREKSGLKVATEVANTEHVEMCLEAGIDVLWIGARTTVNPFYVQEIAESLKGVDIPVFVKNPVAPDLELWMGAIERLEQIGLNKVGAIHRGFQSYNSKPYRNHPQWEIPIELMAKRPDIPLICDISHICGNPELFANIAQKAFDLNMNGLHIEVHPNPAEALSDAKQQIKIPELSDLISRLERRKVSIDNADYLQILEDLRTKIDEVDEGLIRFLYERMELVKKIGGLKKDNQITILQVDRWKEIVSHYTSEAKILDLNEDFLKKFLNILHQESMRQQHDIMNK